MQGLIDFLSNCLLPRRVELFDKVLEQRTKYITVVLEDIYQAQNASAVLRSCECLGIQDVHIIEKHNRHVTDPEVAMGSSKWLNLVKYSRGKSPEKSAINKLRSQGYRIIATTPHLTDQNLDDLALEDGKLALFFGTELTGLSREVIEQADEFVKIPMLGFTESFNISVSAAIILHHLGLKLRQSDIDWKLTPAESQAIKLDWLRKSIKSSAMLEKKYYESLHNPPE